MGFFFSSDPVAQQYIIIIIIYCRTVIQYCYLRGGHHEFFFLSFVLTDQVGQFVSNGHVQLVDRTSSEVRARVRQPFELVHRVQAEEVPVHVGIGKIVSGYVGQRAESFVDVIVLRVLDDVIADGLLVAEERLVVVIRSQVTVDHFCVISHSDLKGHINNINDPCNIVRQYHTNYLLCMHIDRNLTDSSVLNGFNEGDEV